jgi:hypothetical protein
MLDSDVYGDIYDGAYESDRLELDVYAPKSYESNILGDS